jgi:hypothetical protein
VEEVREEMLEIQEILEVQEEVQLKMLGQPLLREIEEVEEMPVEISPLEVEEDTALKVFLS